MTIETIPLAPGIYTEATDRSALNRYKFGQNVRFRKSLPETLGGSTALAGSSFLGKCRRMLTHRTLDGSKYTAIATSKVVQLWNGNAYLDITPLRDGTDAPFSSAALTDPFTTTNGNATVTVAHTGHGNLVGDVAVFSGSSDVGGILAATLNTQHVVTSVLTDSYQFVAATAATSGVTGGGSVNYAYLIHSGTDDSVAGLGWGIGAWRSANTFPNNRGWGDAEPGGSGLIIPASTASLQSWGEDVMYNPRGGSIYHWDASAGTAPSNRMVLIDNAPQTSECIIVSPENRYLIALGAYDGSISDPMFIRWCSAEDFNDWTPSITNTAGDKRLDDGSRIVTAVYSNTQIVILTDNAVYSMFFVGYPDVFGFASKGTACGAISPGAAVAKTDMAFWWSNAKSFNVYDGSSTTQIPCDVLSAIYNDINLQQTHKITSGINTLFNEVRWQYASAGSIENDREAAYNWEEKTWWLGTFDRTAFIDKAQALENPIAAGVDNQLHEHETGTDNSGLPLVKILRTYDFEANHGQEDAGDQLLMINQIYNDFEYLTGSVKITISKRESPEKPVRTKGPKTVTASDPKTSFRIRARQASVEWRCDNLGDSFRMGPLRGDAVLHGRLQ